MFLQPLSWFFEWKSSTHADWCLINIPSFPRDPDSQGSSVSFQISLVPFISSTHAPSYYFPSYSLCIITFCGRLLNWCIWEGHFLPCLILCESLVKSSSPPAQPGLSVLPELPTPASVSRTQRTASTLSSPWKPPAPPPSSPWCCHPLQRSGSDPKKGSTGSQHMGRLPACTSGSWSVVLSRRMD